jgi:hypothetical protein
MGSAQARSDESASAKWMNSLKYAFSEPWYPSTVSRSDAPKAAKSEKSRRGKPARAKIESSFGFNSRR